MQAKVSKHSLMAEGLSAAGGKSYAGEKTLGSRDPLSIKNQLF